MRKINLKEILNVIGLVLVWRLILQLITWIAKTRLNVGLDFAYLFNNPNPWVNNLPQSLKTFANWDSGWYLSIAEKGYLYIADGITNVVFFPLYPLLMRFIASLFDNNFLLAGIILSHIFITLSVIFLYKLVKIDFGQSTAFRTILYMLIFPVSFFFVSVYTESLFIFLSIIAFYFARKNKWLLASIAGLLLSLTKPWGVAIILPLAIEYLEQREFSFKNLRANFLWLLGLPIGLIIQMVFLKIKFGSFFIFASSQKLWHEETAFKFLETIQNYWQNIFITVSDNLAYQTAIAFDFGFFIFGIFLSITVFIFIRKSYGVYSLLACLIPAISAILVSMSRYVLVAFPIYIILAIWGKHKLVNATIIIFFTTLLSYFITLFVHNYWVA